MPAGSETLEILIRTRGGKAAAGELQLVAGKTDGVTGSTRRASGAQKDAAASGGKLASSWKGMIGSAVLLAAKVGALGAAYFGLRGLKNSVETTKDFAAATLGLNKNLGLSVKTASEWVAVAKRRGVDAEAFSLSFSKLATNMRAASLGGEKQIHTFRRLGVSMDVIKRGNFQEVLGEVADGFKNFTGTKANRAAIALELFGRGWKSIVPLLRDGKVAMQDALAVADKYGATLKGKTVAEVKKLIDAEGESKLAMLGLSLTFGTTLAPMLTKAMVKFNEMVLAIRDGKGAWGTIGDVIGWVAGVARTAAHWVGGLGITWVGVRDWVVNAAHNIASAAVVAFDAVTVAADWLSTAAGNVKVAVVGAFDWVRNALGLTGADLSTFVTAAGNYLSILLGAVKLYIGGILLFWRPAWSVIKAVAGSTLGGLLQAVRGFLRIIGGVIKVFTGIFTGDFGMMWRGVKQIFRGAIDVVIGMVRGITAPIRAIISGLGSVIRSAASGMFDGIKDAFRSAYNWIADKIMWIVEKVEWAANKLSEVGPGGGGGIVPGIPDPGDLIPGFARGGVMKMTGAAIVGERGPELLTLPAGAEVTPLDSGGPGLTGGPVREIVRLMTVDGKVLAEAVFGAASTAEARA